MHPEMHLRIPFFKYRKYIQGPNFCHTFSFETHQHHRLCHFDLRDNQRSLEGKEVQYLYQKYHFFIHILLLSRNTIDYTILTLKVIKYQIEVNQDNILKSTKIPNFLNTYLYFTLYYDQLLNFDHKCHREIATRLPFFWMHSHISWYTILTLTIIKDLSRGGGGGGGGEGNLSFFGYPTFIDIWVI